MDSCRYFFLQCSERENMLDGKKEEQVWLVKLIYYTWGCCYTTQHLHKMSPFGLPCRTTVIHPEKKIPLRLLICICFISLCLPSADHMNAELHKKKKHTVTSPLNHSFPHLDLVTLLLALATRMTPFHLNRLFTRCCAIND